MTRLGPQVLPWSEQIRFFAQLCLRRVLGADRVPMYVPDFKKAFEHFAIHAGGRAIIDGLQENLSLSDYQVEPSRATLYRYGNTSSSSVFYELNYIERDGRVKAGDRVWQIAIGSGPKCNSAVWVALKTLPGVVGPKQTPPSQQRKQSRRIQAVGMKHFETTKKIYILIDVVVVVAAAACVDVKVAVAGLVAGGSVVIDVGVGVGAVLPLLPDAVACRLQRSISLRLLLR
jgi:hypothetical protein